MNGMSLLITNAQINVKCMSRQINARDQDRIILSPYL